MRSAKQVKVVSLSGSGQSKYFWSKRFLALQRLLLQPCRSPLPISYLGDSIRSYPSRSLQQVEQPFRLERMRTKLPFND